MKQHSVNAPFMPSGQETAETHSGSHGAQHDWAVPSVLNHIERMSVLK